VAFRQKDDFKGSRVSWHIHPDGTIMPFKIEFPIVKVTAATKEEVGEHNARWLDPQFVADWQASNQASDGLELSGSTKGKGKAKARPPSGSSSKQHHSSQKTKVASSSSESVADSGRYTSDPNTGEWYYYTETGAVVYLGPNSQQEYYYDEQGQVVWL
jgi:hypothetical protein